MFGFKQDSGVHVVRFQLMESGTFDDQHRRPYEMKITPDTMLTLQERMVQQPKIQPAAFGGIANQIVAPSASSQGVLSIPNGWGTKRWRFLLEIEYNAALGGKMREIILGYSEFFDISHNNSIDPRLQFIVNSVSNMRITDVPTPMGRQSVTTPIDNSHILFNQDWGGQQDRGLETIRPMDIFSLTSRSAVMQEFGQADVYDVRNRLRDEPMKSFRNNGVASNFVGAILGNYQNAAAKEVIGESRNDTLSQAGSYAQEPVLSADKFLSQVALYSGMNIGNMFTLKEIEKLDPTYWDRTVIARLGSTNQAYNRGAAQPWGASDHPTLLATILSQAVPGIMMEVGLTHLAFSSTNMDLVGQQFLTLISHMDSFSTASRQQQGDLFIRRFEHELMRDLTMENQVGLRIAIQADLLGETWVQVSVNGESPIDYVTPSFCDALTVPVITTNDNQVFDMGIQFNKIFANIDEAQGFGRASGESNWDGEGSPAGQWQFS